MAGYVLSLDQGTTSSRSILFDQDGRQVALSQKPFKQYFPQSGWVEHDAVEIWETQLATMQEVLSKAGITEKDLAAIGITNQRETVVVWDRKSGMPICHAIVWQDRRTSDLCRQMKDAGLEPALSSITGLKIDPYFSATKVQWILDHEVGARSKADRGELCMGTIDSWLIWNLTDGARHVTDATNACRTLLYNLHSGEWDEDLLKEFMIPESMLPEIVDSSGTMGEWNGVPIAGIAGDQQAALFGQGCYEPGSAKNTYGTGCFMLMNTGERAVVSENQLLTTVAWQVAGKREYALEGSVFIAGALFQWLRDGLELVEDVREFDQLAGSVENSGGVVLVPAFAGLGAPHWDPFARGTMMGLSRGVTKAHVCRAAMEAVSFQSAELLECMERDAGMKMTELRVDGGASVSNLLMQTQANLIQRNVVRPKQVETTAFGAAALAGLGVGLWESKQAISEVWQEDKRFAPGDDHEGYAKLRKDWDKAVERCKAWVD
ncbi:glycerol kinase [Rubritalea squalenifaciens DSM 18772]|uniref:Glycerol kinase n=1 Tax=Rubritalea squalenifaciens DSM 18772 TaxID=1123071 RepID=A0A1M6EAJ8_9BACT|nr:glycerol kinase GlpK [Rubritalea squalenifaciens]SHI82389.1 glycerol kinase [Rubritalea squalenifaciens DSM 18772]